jgi:hypothetical protein
MPVDPERKPQIALPNLQVVNPRSGKRGMLVQPYGLGDVAWPLASFQLED